MLKQKLLETKIESVVDCVENEKKESQRARLDIWMLQYPLSGVESHLLTSTSL
jgi:hypothetical protein